MKFVYFLVIILSILGMCPLTKEEQSSPINYNDLIQKLSDPVGSGEKEGLKSLVLKAQTFLEQMKDFCIIGSHNISVSTKCCDDLKTILLSIVGGDMEAIKMLDAFGKPPSGIILGNSFFPGDYKECKSINLAASPSFRPKYCQAGIPVKFKNNPQEVMFTFGLCVPNSCSPKDAEHLFKAGLHMLPYHVGDKLNVTVNCQKEIALDTKAIVAITICSIFFVLSLLGTFYDVISKLMDESDKLIINSPNEESRYNEIQDDGDVALLRPEPSRVPDCLKKFLLCFSILKNTEKLLKTKLPNQSLPSIHGIRFLSMTWVILGHTYFFGAGVTGNIMTLYGMTKRFTFQAIITGIFSVDTFFLLSGMLVAYGTLKLLSERGKINWFYYYFHRYYRLTPTYMVLLMIYVCLLRYFGSGPYWVRQEFGDECKDVWWRNFLYVNNFILNSGCMGWTWYLANDMQFYIISPLLLFFLYKRPKIGILLTMILLCIHFIVTSVEVIKYSIKSSINPEYWNIYEKPFYRIGPYLIGILLGYALHVTKCRMTLNKNIHS